MPTLPIFNWNKALGLFGSALSLLLMGVGCVSPTTPREAIEREIRREHDDARDAFRLGQIDRAKKAFHDAILKAWNADDLADSGTIAYNLAALLASGQETERAEAWLVDARVNLRRSARSVGNVWLLQAEIAGAAGRLDEARECLRLASCSQPPCEPVDDLDACDPDCQESTAGLECLSSCGKRRDAKRQEDCQRAYRTRVAIAQANLALRCNDVTSAKRALECARTCAADVCDEALAAEYEATAAEIAMAQQCWSSAGFHRDAQLAHLKAAGILRDLSTVLDAAAEAYINDGQWIVAADRLCRSARIWIARGKADLAWQRIREAAERVAGSPDTDTLIRLTLTATFLQEHLKQDGEEKESDLFSKSFSGHDATPLVDGVYPPVYVDQKRVSSRPSPEAGNP
ncbi:MAG: hypothetical protein AAF958_09845 [Planctomycetota bacterium]